MLPPVYTDKHTGRWLNSLTDTNRQTVIEMIRDKMTEGQRDRELASVFVKVKMTVHITTQEMVKLTDRQTVKTQTDKHMVRLADTQTDRH